MLDLQKENVQYETNDALCELDASTLEEIAGGAVQPGPGIPVFP
jgi:hypothetical protein